jgi:hypothetical protein
MSEAKKKFLGLFRSKSAAGKPSNESKDVPSNVLPQKSLGLMFRRTQNTVIADTIVPTLHLLETLEIEKGDTPILPQI